MVIKPLALFLVIPCPPRINILFGVKALDGPAEDFFKNLVDELEPCISLVQSIDWKRLESCYESVHHVGRGLLVHVHPTSYTETRPGCRDPTARRHSSHAHRRPKCKSTTRMFPDSIRTCKG